MIAGVESSCKRVRSTEVYRIIQWNWLVANVGAHGKNEHQENMLLVIALTNVRSCLRTADIGAL
jgi:hypothetical protein